MKYYRSNRGFTLVEMLVAVSLFSVVAFLVVTTFMSITEAYRKSQAIRLVIDNLNFAMDSITLRLRDGNNYRCGYPGDSECDNESGNEAITFNTFDGRSFVYRKFLSNANPDTGKQYAYLAQCFSTPDDVDSWCSAVNVKNYTQITSPDIDLSDVRFYVYSQSAANAPENEPGRALIILGGTASFGQHTSNFNLQTSVSERQ